MSSAATSAPALETNSRNSARDSSESSPGEDGAGCEVVSGAWPSSAPATGPFKRTAARAPSRPTRDRKSTRLNSSHSQISYAVFCLKKKKKKNYTYPMRKKKQKTET